MTEHGRRRNSLLACMVYLRRIAPTLTLTEALAFLYVAENPGIRVKELSSLMLTTQATASRTARSLVCEGDPGALSPCRGWLIMSSNGRENISRHLYLTPLGVQITQRLDMMIARARPIGGAVATMSGFQ